jgi:hypothetical protein
MASYMDENSAEAKIAIRAAIEASILCQKVQKDLIGFEQPKKSGFFSKRLELKK